MVVFYHQEDKKELVSTYFQKHTDGKLTEKTTRKHEALISDKWELVLLTDSG